MLEITLVCPNTEKISSKLFLTLGRKCKIYYLSSCCSKKKGGTLKSSTPSHLMTNTMSTLSPPPAAPYTSSFLKG